jgi:hypothetical protein
MKMLNAKIDQVGSSFAKLNIMKQTPMHAITPKYARGVPKAGATISTSASNRTKPLIIILPPMEIDVSPLSLRLIVERARTVPARKMKVGAQ